MSWEANSIFKKLLHGKRKSALLNLTWSGLLCRVVWSVSQLLYLLQRAGHFKFFSPSFFVGLELVVDVVAISWDPGNNRPVPRRRPPEGHSYGCGADTRRGNRRISVQETNKRSGKSL